MAQKIIWALTDGRPGNDNQAMAVAQKLVNDVTRYATGEAVGYEIHRINFSWIAHLPNFLLGTTRFGIQTRFTPPYPDIVISAGRKLSRVARIVKKRSKKASDRKCKAIQLMWPGYGHEDFDLIFTPQHDKITPHPNLITTYGPPNRVTPELLAIEAEKWQPHIPVDAVTVIAVLIGNITPADAKKLATAISASSSYPVISTSRRTSAAAIAALKTHITGERYLYEWKPNTENPYFGFLGLADSIIVTGDSISMMAESCTTGKPTYIFECANTPAKHKNFMRSLIESGRAKLLSCTTGLSLEQYSYAPLDTLDSIIKKILERI